MVMMYEVLTKVLYASTMSLSNTHLYAVCMCSGFWEAYCMVRGFLHARLRQELVRLPTTVIFTGHSLGG
ncbi:hypothetical protein EON63_07680 [archaeon]|nr:MAG: hypothetical protein EON63_07680 [archaeon]